MALLAHIWTLSLITDCIGWFPEFNFPNQPYWQQSREAIELAAFYFVIYTYKIGLVYIISKNILKQ